MHHIRANSAPQVPRLTEPLPRPITTRVHLRLYQPDRTTLHDK